MNFNIGDRVLTSFRPIQSIHNQIGIIKSKKSAEVWTVEFCHNLTTYDFHEAYLSKINDEENSLMEYSISREHAEILVEALNQRGQEIPENLKELCLSKSSKGLIEELKVSCSQYLEITDVQFGLLFKFNTMKNSEFLEWVTERIIHVYGESPNADYIRRLYKIVHETREREQRLTSSTEELQDFKEYLIKCIRNH